MGLQKQPGCRVHSHAQFPPGLDRPSSTVSGRNRSVLPVTGVAAVGQAPSNSEPIRSGRPPCAGDIDRCRPSTTPASGWPAPTSIPGSPNAYVWTDGSARATCRRLQPERLGDHMAAGSTDLRLRPTIDGRHEMRHHPRAGIGNSGGSRTGLPTRSRPFTSTPAEIDLASASAVRTATWIEDRTVNPRRIASRT